MKVCVLILVASLGFGAGGVAAADPPDPGWRLSLPGWEYVFPRDHGVHREFKTEWWYVTGRLEDEGGRVYGFQVTFFRQGFRPELPVGISRFVMADLKFAHFAIVDVQTGRFMHWQKSARGAFGEAGFGGVETGGRPARLAWIEDWQLEWRAEGGFELESSSGAQRLKLTMTPSKGPVIHGKNGVSQKAAGEGRASHYYSFTRLRTEGELAVDGKARRVRGEAWFDHEWASNQLTAEQVGWNWFSLQMNDGTELMLYQMRLQGGEVDPNSSGTFVDSDGRTIHLRSSDFKLTPLAFREKYPIAWQVEIPGLEFSARVKTPVEDQELRLQEIAYWEGLIQITGKRGGHDVAGHGYLELTGYRQPLDPLRTVR